MLRSMRVPVFHETATRSERRRRKKSKCGKCKRHQQRRRFEQADRRQTVGRERANIPEKAKHPSQQGETIGTGGSPSLIGRMGTPTIQSSMAYRIAPVVNPRTLTRDATMMSCYSMRRLKWRLQIRSNPLTSESINLCGFRSHAQSVNRRIAVPTDEWLGICVEWPLRNPSDLSFLSFHIYCH